MSVKGTLRADELVVARIEVDLLVNPAKVHASAALVSSEGGETLAWTEADGGAWSKETMKKLQELRSSMEEDLARVLFQKEVKRAANKEEERVGGLGEHLGENTEAPSI